MTLFWVKVDAFANAVILQIFLDSVSVNDDVLTSDEVHGLCWVIGVGYLVVKQSVFGPVKVTLNRIGDANFGCDKVVQQNFQRSFGFPIAKVVTHVTLPQTEHDGIDKGRAIDEVWPVFQ